MGLLVLSLHIERYADVLLHPFEKSFHGYPLEPWAQMCVYGLDKRKSFSVLVCSFDWEQKIHVMRHNGMI